MELAAGLIGVVVGAGVTVGVAWLERRWRRQDVRAAEKRARLEERFESVRRYAAELREFVSNAVIILKVWEEMRAAEGLERPERLAQERAQELRNRWYEVGELAPPRGTWFVGGDKEVQLALLMLEAEAQRCWIRCHQCLEGGDVMSEEEARQLEARADEHLKKMLERMEEAVEEVER